MDAGIADAINRRDAQLIAQRLDTYDDGVIGKPWYRRPVADALMGDDRNDRAWLISAWATRTPGISFDGAPADCDWDNLFAHFRAEILSRRRRGLVGPLRVEVPGLPGVHVDWHSNPALDSCPIDGGTRKIPTADAAVTRVGSVV